MKRLSRPPYACLVAVFVAVTLLSTSKSALTADTAAASGSTPRVVNVTSDSVPGWLPSEELERQARKTATDFMTDMDSGKYADAYAFLADVDRKDQSLSAFSERLREFNAHAGAVVERRIVTVTWTKNQDAPLPGIYAALDLVSRFANIDRHCGYLVLYQAPSGGVFQIMRQEDNFLDNVTAKQSSPEEVDKIWAGLQLTAPVTSTPNRHRSPQARRYPKRRLQLSGTRPWRPR